MADFIRTFSPVFTAKALQKKEEKHKTGKKEEINRVGRKKERKKEGKKERKIERHSSSISTLHSYFTSLAISLAEENSEPVQLHRPDRQ